jgi:CRISPR-associated protein Cmr2
MSKYITIFHLGPIQSYINTAKRTQDYWAGSYMLSYLSAIAISTVNNQLTSSIIFPYFEKDELISVVELYPHDTNQHDFRNIKNYIGTLPNRFVTIHEDKDKLKRLLKESKDNIVKAYNNITSQVRSVLEKKIFNGYVDSQWKEIWERQESDFIETMWIIHEIDDSKNYGSNYRQAERLLGARKGIRNFKQVPEPGEKCTLCGQQQALVTSSKNVRTFWSDLRESLKNSKIPYAFRPNERLCSICCVKRLAPVLFFTVKASKKEPLTFPSTSTIAVSSTLDKLAQKWNELEIQKNVLSFKEYFNKLGLKSFSKNNRSLPIVQFHLEDKLTNNQDIFRWDGDAYITDTYQKDKLRKEYHMDDSINISAIETCKESLELLIKNASLKEIPLSKYYAVLMMDGDDMGKHLYNCNREGQHRDFSERLSSFSKEIVPLIAQHYFRSKVAYFGGDEGVVFVSLEDLFPLMRCLRAAFSGHIVLDKNGLVYHVDFGKEGGDYIEDNAKNKQYKTAGAGKTASMGVVIAHHQQSLVQVMEALHYCLEKRAKQVDEKDAFSIALMKRSGGTTWAVSKWYYPAGNSNVIDVLEHLEDMKNLYRNKGLTSNWLLDLDREKHALQSIGAIKSEIRRLALRHCSKGYQESLKEIIEKSLLAFEKILSIKPELDNFIQLEFIANYIAKGGGS